MSKIFGTLAAVLLAFSAFVAYKNKEAKEAEIKVCKNEIQIYDTKTEEFKVASEDYQYADNVRKENIAKAEKVEAEVDSLKEEFKKSEKQVAKLERSYKAKEQELAEAKDALKDLPDPKILVPKVKRMRGDLAEAKDSIASEEARLANLAQQDKSGKARISKTRELISLQMSGKSFPTLKTKIRSVYRNWGFVVLSAGDRQGVVTDSILDVMRGGELIAKLKVTAVEAGTSSASIILDSVAPGVTLRPGDVVVAEREATNHTANKVKSSKTAAH